MIKVDHLTFEATNAFLHPKRIGSTHLDKRINPNGTSLLKYATHTSREGDREGARGW